MSGQLPDLGLISNECNNNRPAAGLYTHYAIMLCDRAATHQLHPSFTSTDGKVETGSYSKHRKGHPLRITSYGTHG